MPHSRMTNRARGRDWARADRQSACSEQRAGSVSGVSPRARCARKILGRARGRKGAGAARDDAKHAAQEEPKPDECASIIEDGGRRTEYPDGVLRQVALSHAGTTPTEGPL